MISPRLPPVSNRSLIRRGRVGIAGPIGFGVERYRESRDLSL
jgi:hypothetical protein